MGVAAVGALLGLPCCAHVTVDPVEVKPIYIKLDAAKESLAKRAVSPGE